MSISDKSKGFPFVEPGELSHSGKIVAKAVEEYEDFAGKEAAETEESPEVSYTQEETNRLVKRAILEGQVTRLVILRAQIKKAFIELGSAETEESDAVGSIIISHIAQLQKEVSNL